MNLPKYDYTPDEAFINYEFFSEGQSGRIRKMIVFRQLITQPFVVYNLAFGDLNEETGDIDDGVISNNQDRDKVLATVAATIHDFSDKNGNHLIYAEGSSLSRSRLYQMSIARNLEEISMEFEIKGLTEKGWEPFQKNVNYKAFLTNRK
jgi:hypothetical protein